MKIVVLGIVGMFFGAIVGGIAGIGLGMIWTGVFRTSCFEGYCSMLVFYSFMPIGLLLGALAGAVGLGWIAARN